MNRLFDDVFHDLGPFHLERLRNRGLGWPSLEVNDSGQEVRIFAELPGLEDKDVQVEFANGVLIIKGEKRAENEDKDRLFSERYYGRFERRIPIDDVAEDKITAAFKNGLLTSHFLHQSEVNNWRETCSRLLLVQYRKWRIKSRSK